MTVLRVGSVQIVIYCLRKYKIVRNLGQSPFCTDFNHETNARRHLPPIQMSNRRKIYNYIFVFT